MRHIPALKAPKLRMPSTPNSNQYDIYDISLQLSLALVH